MAVYTQREIDEKINRLVQRGMDPSMVRNRVQQDISSGRVQVHKGLSGRLKEGGGVGGFVGSIIEPFERTARQTAGRLGYGITELGTASKNQSIRESSKQRLAKLQEGKGLLTAGEVEDIGQFRQGLARFDTPEGREMTKPFLGDTARNLATASSPLIPGGIGGGVKATAAREALRGGLLGFGEDDSTLGSTAQSAALGGVIGAGSAYAIPRARPAIQKVRDRLSRVNLADDVTKEVSKKPGKVARFGKGLENEGKLKVLRQEIPTKKAKQILAMADDTGIDFNDLEDFAERVTKKGANARATKSAFASQYADDAIDVSNLIDDLNKMAEGKHVEGLITKAGSAEEVKIQKAVAKEILKDLKKSGTLGPGYDYLGAAGRKAFGSGSQGQTAIEKGVRAYSYNGLRDATTKAFKSRGLKDISKLNKAIRLGREVSNALPDVIIDRNGIPVNIFDIIAVGTGNVPAMAGAVGVRSANSPKVMIGAGKALQSGIRFPAPLKGALSTGAGLTGEGIGNVARGAQTALAPVGAKAAQTAASTGLATFPGAVGGINIAAQSYLNSQSGLESGVSPEVIAESRIKAVESLMRTGMTDPFEIRRELNGMAKEQGFESGDFTVDEVRDIQASLTTPQGAGFTFTKDQLRQALLMDIALTGGDNYELFTKLYETLGTDLGTGGSENLTITQKNRLSSLDSAEAALGQLENLLTDIDLSDTAIGGRVGGRVRGVGASTGLLPNAKIRSYNSLREGTVSVFAKMFGEVGNLSESEQERALKNIPSITDSEEEATLKLNNLRTIIGSIRETIVSGY